MTKNKKNNCNTKKNFPKNGKFKNLDRENKEKIISLRFKPSELEKLDRNCSEVGLTRSAYITRKILSLPVQPARVPSINWEAYEYLTAIAYHLPRIGNNLNQIAKVLNTAQLEGNSVKDEIADPEDLKQTVAVIKEQIPIVKQAARAIIGTEAS